MTTNAELIAAWRREHSSTRLTGEILRDILGVETLRGADLRGADLRGANLRGANLRGADLRGADLHYADLRGADLHYADLCYADLSDANLCYADLSDANLYGADLRGADFILANLRGTSLHRSMLDAQHVFQVFDLPSGVVNFWPTPGGWELSIGCWENRTLAALERLIDSEDVKDWPGGDGFEERHPFLEALIPLLKLHAKRHADYQRELADYWAGKK